MEEKSLKKYYIGLDLGTNSVGYAVLNPDLSVVKKSGKHLWGVDLFDSAETAANTRLIRSSRRRYERRKERIRLLQMLMRKEVNEVDPLFFARLSNSFLLHKSSDEEFGRDNICNLFDGKYSDKNYYGKYRTIYHLRKELCENKSKADIRLVYLAIHHIIKYRGNFLHDEERLSAESINLESILNSFFDDYNNEYTDEDGVICSFCSSVDAHSVVQIISDTKTKKKYKKDELKKLFTDVKYKKQSEAFINLILGYSANLCALFPQDLLEDNAEIGNIKISFEDDDFETKALDFPATFGDEKTNLIINLQRFFSALTLTLILGEGNSFVYQSMIKRYDKNKEDLNNLKTALKYDEEVYDAFFNRPPKSGANFISYFKPNRKGEKRVIVKRSTRKDFYSACKKILDSLPDSEAKSYCLQEIDNDDFLIKLNSTQNGVFPYQLNLNELERILDNQGDYYPELKANRDKIISILTFRRPYSVGVINSNSRFSWIDEEDVKKERAYPWNFEEVVDVMSASRKFMERLTDRDDYFNEPVLPKDSVIYQTYNVLNELSNLRLEFKSKKARPLTVEEKSAVFFNLFIDSRSATYKNLINLLAEKFDEHPINISGFIDKDAKKFSTKMSSYRSLRRTLGDCISKEDGQIVFDYEKLDLFEKCIKVIAIYNDKNIRKRIFKDLHFDNKSIEALQSFNFSGWGKLSEKCLLGVKGFNDLSVIETMLTTEYNFMQILHSDELGFKGKFFGEKNKPIDKLTYSLVEEMHVSPSSKRTIWQALKVIAEIEKIMGDKPHGIYIESTRTDEAKNVAKKRVDVLRELFDNIERENEIQNSSYYDDFVRVRREINNTDPSRFDEEKVYLYILQLGRCMYSNQKLSLDSLSEYEVDHIIPRHYIKDDSFQNKALVLRNENQNKSGSLTLEYDIRQKMAPFWNMLYKCKLMSKKKLNSLLRESYSDRDLEGFINRQLVDTGISTKYVRNALQALYPDADVDFVKPIIANLFRSSLVNEGYLEFCKLRELNDMHHAKDAYLTAVTGVFTRKVHPIWGANAYSRNARFELDSNLDKNKIVELCQKRYGIVVDCMMHANPHGNYEVDWGICYNNILRNFGYNDCLINRKKEMGPGQFYGATLISPRKKDGNVPLRYCTTRDGVRKPLPCEYYGNYTGQKEAYYVNVTFKKGKKIETILIGIPTVVSYEQKNNPNAIAEYLTRYFASQKGKEYISHDKRIILKYQLINYMVKGKKHPCYITSSSELINAVQLVVDKRFNLLLYCLAHPKMRVQFLGKDYSLKKSKEEFEPLMKEFILHLAQKIKSLYPLYESIADKIVAFVENGGFDNLPYCTTQAEGSNKSVKGKNDFISDLMKVTGASSSSLDMKVYEGFDGASCFGRLHQKSVYHDRVDWIDTSITGYYRAIIPVKVKE